MPRGPRVVSPTGVYHVTSRGNRRQSIFVDDNRTLFLRLLNDTVTRHRWRCSAYCLMSNHFHVLVEMPPSRDDLSLGMHRLNGRYAQWFNDLHELDGHLFQGRFTSVPIEGEGHLLESVRYISLNPVRAGICAAPEEWPWSSYPAMIGRAAPWPFLCRPRVLELFGADPRRAREHFVSFVNGWSP